jgi:hypothetical protein
VSCSVRVGKRVHHPPVSAIERSLASFTQETDSILSGLHSKLQEGRRKHGENVPRVQTHIPKQRARVPLVPRVDSRWRAKSSDSHPVIIGTSLQSFEHDTSMIISGLERKLKGDDYDDDVLLECTGRQFAVGKIER